MNTVLQIKKKTFNQYQYKTNDNKYKLNITTNYKLIVYL